MKDRIEIIIEGYKIIIEKGEDLKTIPTNQHPIQYNKIELKRKYYKKTDEQYHRKPLKGSTYKTKTILKTSQFNKIVKQEPLLDQDYWYLINF